MDFSSQDLVKLAQVAADLGSTTLLAAGVLGDGETHEVTVILGHDRGEV